MTISARIHYATLALVELALRRRSDNPMAAGEISEIHGIPGPFLVQILRTLRTAGWVQSIRGSQGGYRLSIDPADVTLLDIAKEVGCPDSNCQTESTDTPANRLLVDVWESASAASRAVLANTTLAEVVSQASQEDEVMFYI